MAPLITYSRAVADGHSLFESHCEILCKLPSRGKSLLTDEPQLMAPDSRLLPYNNLMPQHPDVLIIGGGVIGLTAAYFLAREGVKVEVIDKGDLGQEASWAGAGILPPGNPARARTPIDKLRAHSATLFPILSSELRDRSGIDNGYLRSGGVGFPDEQPNQETAELRNEGIVIQALKEEELLRLEPAVARGLGQAYHIPDMAQLRNPWHLRALLASCRFLGVTLRPGCPIDGLQSRSGRLAAVNSAQGPLQAGNYLIATGAWTDSLLAQVGWRPGIRPIRGQIALLNTGAPFIRRVLLCGPRYLVPRTDGRVLVGSTEEDVGFVKQTTAGAISGLLTFACRLVPGLAGASVERCWAGLRPGSPDGLPFIGPVPGTENLYVAAGHFRSGIGLSPATAMAIKELILCQPLTVPIEAFRLDRGSIEHPRPAFQS
jgi:glycine oxidase